MEQQVIDFAEMAKLTDYPMTQEKVMFEESLELLESRLHDRKTLTLDGIGDMAFTVELNKYIDPEMRFDLMDHILGFFHPDTVSQALQAVIDSNNTKFDYSEEDAQLTAVHYDTLGVVVRTEEVKTGVWATFSHYDQLVDNKAYPADKLLKSVVNFKEPDFSHVELMLME